MFLAARAHGSLETACFDDYAGTDKEDESRESEHKVHLLSESVVIDLARINAYR